MDLKAACEALGPRSHRPSLNLKHLDEVTEGDDEFKREIIGLFFEDAAERLSLLIKAVDGGDAATLEREAHALKGAGRNLGAERFGELALSLEMKAKSGSLQGAQEILAELETEFKHVQHVLEQV
jgi:HPt (histidine-containing phosphotransfer) domain-containing protein